MRKREPDEEVGVELARLEAMLAADIRAERPRIDPAFSQDLDGRVARRFREEPEAGPVARRRRALPALAAASVVLITGGVVAGQLGGDEGASPRPGGPAASQAPAPQGSESGRSGAAAPSGEAFESAEPETDLRRRDRRVERTATLSLAVAPDEVGPAADRAIDVAERHGAIVMLGAVTSRGESPRASIELRVPTGRARSLLADLSDLGEVRAQEESTQDVTAQFATAQDRLSDLRGERRSVLRRLAAANEAGGRAVLRERLRQLRSQIAAARGDLAAERQRSAYATISLAIAGVGGAKSSGEAGLGGAFDRAGGVVEDIAGGAIVGLAALSPLVVLGLLAYGGLRISRRRRERALGPG